MMVEKMSLHVPFLRSRRALGLLLAAASLFLVFVTYLSIPPPDRNRMMAAVAAKTSRFRRPGPPPPPTPKNDTVLAQAVYDAAANSTVGLHSIEFINLPHRHDRFDAAAIQSHLSGIRLTRAPAVLADELRDQGLPPTDKADGMATFKPGEKACYRAHANVWQKMLWDDVPAVLVLESDAGWDVHFRDIMATLNTNFRQLLRRENPGVDIPNNPDDPWAARSGLWDVLAVGHCFANRREDGGYIIYPDAHAPRRGYKMEKIDHALNGERIVYRASGMVCTTGYIVSQTGAGKLLVRTNWKFEAPIDLIMSMMTNAGELTVYAVDQKPVMQWQYKTGLGMGLRGADSDINSGPNKGDKSTREGWADAEKTRSVWKPANMYESAQIVDFGMDRAWERMIGT